MTPEEKLQFETLKKQVETLVGVLDIPFIENAKRRIVEPELERNNLLGLGEVLLKNTTDTASGTTKSVDESGVSSYSVAKEFDGTITIEDQDGSTYKLGYYTP